MVEVSRALLEARLPKFRESNLLVFHRLGFVGGRAVWVAKRLESKLVCVLSTGLGGGLVAGVG